MGLNGTRSKNLSPIAVLQNGTPTPFGPYNNIKVLVVVWAPVHANIVLGARTPNGKQHSTVRHFRANINHVFKIRGTFMLPQWVFWVVSSYKLVWCIAPFWYFMYTVHTLNYDALQRRFQSKGLYFRMGALWPPNHVVPLVSRQFGSRRACHRSFATCCTTLEPVLLIERCQRKWAHTEMWRQACNVHKTRVLVGQKTHGSIQRDARFMVGPV